MTSELTDEQYELVYGKPKPEAAIGFDASLGTVTARIIADLTSKADTFAASIGENLMNIDRNKTVIREHLESTGQIAEIPTLSGTDYSIAAIDGGALVESLYSMDLLATVAVTAEGIIGTRTSEPMVLSWADIRDRNTENKQITTMRMLISELHILTQIGHDVRIIDGSHMNPFIPIAQAISKGGSLAYEAIAALEEVDLTVAVDTLTTPGNGVVSLAKGDTGTVLGDELKHAIPALANMHGMTDKALASLILEDGEMLKPHRLGTMTEGRLNVSNFDDLPRSLITPAKHFTASMEPLRNAIRRGYLRTAFIKPKGSLTSVRLQFMSSVDDTDAAYDEAQELIARIAAETVGPDLQEPFPQYAADLAAKTISHGKEALKYSILAALPPEASDYAALIMRGYRT